MNARARVWVRIRFMVMFSVKDGAKSRACVSIRLGLGLGIGLRFALGLR